MSGKEIEEIEIVRGSENVFRDLGHPDADILYIKAELAAEIIGVLNDKKLNAKKAAETLKISETDISLIRKPDLQTFTIDRLVNVLTRLGFQVKITVTEVV